MSKKNNIKEKNVSVQKEINDNQSLLDRLKMKININNSNLVSSIFEIIISIGTILLVLINLIIYIINKTQFKFYGLNFSMLSHNINSIIYILSMSISVIILLSGCCYIFYYLLVKHVKKFNIKLFLEDIIVFFIYLIIIDFVYYIIYKSAFLSFRYTLEDVFLFREFSKIIFIIFVSIFIFIFIYYFVKSKIMKRDSQISEKSIDFFGVFTIVACIVIGFSVIVSGVYTFILEETKGYYFIDDTNVIVYSTEDYYITLECAIELDDNGNEVLVFYRNTQNKIPSNNVPITYKTFETGRFDEKPKDTSLNLDKK